MTPLAQLRLQVRAQEKRIAALEAAEAARAAPSASVNALRSRIAAVVTKRLSLWSKLVLLHLQYGRGRLTKLKVCIKYGLGDPSDLCRFLSAGDARGVPEGSIPAERYYGALRKFIAELETRRVAHGAIFPWD